MNNKEIKALVAAYNKKPMRRYCAKCNSERAILANFDCYGVYLYCATCQEPLFDSYLNGERINRYLINKGESQNG